MKQVDIQYMDIAEFRRLGFLQEANRLFFHPLGLALDIEILDDGQERLGGIWDFRSDPEGIIFGDDIINSEECRVKRATVGEEFERHAAERRRLFGSEIQPVVSEPGTP